MHHIYVFGNIPRGLVDEWAVCRAARLSLTITTISLWKLSSACATRQITEEVLQKEPQPEYDSLHLSLHLGVTITTLFLRFDMQFQ